ncbi:MAG TPA: teichoic acid ABC transporter ATP-binding protein [Actinobacteria bacterium]|nr:teichoic acid ABC transporter ATP-binding protein [Actinomycetota bacterium]
MTLPLIEVTDLGIAYRLSRNQAATFKEFLIRAVKRQVSFEKLWAVRGVSFDVARGEVFGIVGPNGAGKSSLMKVVARVLPPSEGRVIVRGAVAPMIELGAGFNTELTARENIILYGTLLGRRPEFMRERVNGILEWADLLEFSDVPVRSFSTGMMARLGFSVATDVRPDILVVDEVLSVGDESFQLRSRARITELMNAGVSVVLVSHSLGLVADIADRVMWMDHGMPKMIGEPGAVVDAYRRWSSSSH